MLTTRRSTTTCFFGTCPRSPQGTLKTVPTLPHPLKQQCFCHQQLKYSIAESEAWSSRVHRVEAHGGLGGASNMKVPWVPQMGRGGKQNVEITSWRYVESKQSNLLHLLLSWQTRILVRVTMWDLTKRSDLKKFFTLMLVSSNNTWSEFFSFISHVVRYLVHLMNHDTQEWRECVVIMFLHCLLQTVFTTPVNSVPCYSTKITRTPRLLLHSNMQRKGHTLSDNFLTIILLTTTSDTLIDF